jgi:hypothetical protein
MELKRYALGSWCKTPEVKLKEYKLVTAEHESVIATRILVIGSCVTLANKHNVLHDTVHSQKPQ